MAFSERRRRLVDASFATFGDEASWSHGPDGTGSWTGTDVLVRFRERDEDDRFASVTVKRRSEIMRVRSWEIEQPEPGDLVEVVGGPNAGSYVVRAGAMLDDKGVWDCPVQREAA